MKEVHWRKVENIVTGTPTTPNICTSSLLKRFLSRLIVKCDFETRGMEEFSLTGGRRGREVQEEGDRCIHIADSLLCTAEINITL